MRLNNTIAAILLALIPLCAAAAAPTETSAAQGPAVTSGTEHAMTSEDVSAFFDGLIPLQLAEYDIAGAVLVVVRDGRVLFAKGYGYADVARKLPVSVDTTLFRTASTGKLFTWTAVMQLVEQGKLDLDRDVNDYLDFRIPATFPQPITLRNLMTHTAGFEERVQDLFYPDAAHIRPLDEYLKTHLPRRVFVPGTTPAYSNYGASLAGYIVQRVSGEPYADYIENHIFRPLGMAHSSFRQPLPEVLRPLMSNGYVVASGPAEPFELASVVPAGSAANTAADMARFMSAYLADGQLEGAQILLPKTVRLMQSPQFVNVEDMNAMGLGFYEESRNGQRIFGHAGDTRYFHGDLHLIPAAGLGFYICYNSAGNRDVGYSGPRIIAWHAFLDRYFPYATRASTTTASDAQDARDIVGRYLISRRGQSTIAAGLWTLVPILEPKVFGNSDGTLSVTGFNTQSGEPKKFREIAPLVYREVDGQDRIAFKREPSGRMRLVIDYPVMVFQKTRWYENSGFNFALVAGASAVLILTLLLWPVMALIRRHYGHQLDLTRSQRRIKMLVRAVCAVDIVFLGVFFAFLAIVLSTLNARQTAGGDLLLHLLQLVGWLGVLGTLVVLYNAWQSWRVPARGLWSRMGDTVIALACVAFVWIVFMWNMLQWRVHF
jgi:CubicO group peptidase (beta-lactamase class C family)